MLFSLFDFHYLIFQIWSVPLYVLVCCWFPLLYFSFQLLYSLALVFFFLIFSSSLLGFSCIHPFSPWFGKHLYDYFNSLSGRYLNSVSLRSFLRLCFVLFHLKHISLFPHLAWFYVFASMYWKNCHLSQSWRSGLIQEMIFLLMPYLFVVS